VFCALSTMYLREQLVETESLCVIAREVIGLLSLWVTAVVAACLVLMGLPQMGGGGGRDLQGIGFKRWGSRPACSGTTLPGGPGPAEIPQVRVRVTSRKKPMDKTALVRVILCALLSLRF
jgi:hypothetical protein